MTALPAPIQNTLPTVKHSEAVQALLDNTLSANTKRAYNTAFKRFEAMGGAIPASAEQMAEIVAQCEMKPASLNVFLAAVGKAHRLAGFVNPCDNELVASAVKGFKRVQGTRQRRAKPLFTEDVARLLSNGKDAVDVRDNALLLLAFTTAARRSELVSLNIEQIEKADNGYYVLLERSKTDQDGAGHVFHVPFGKTSLCPATALEKLLEVLAQQGITDGALFRKLSKAGKFLTRLTDQSVNLVFKKLADRVGFDASVISGHSSRRGAISSLDRANVPRKDIRKLSRHKSDRMIDLYSEDKGLAVNPFSALV